ncbi:MAG: Rab family GTPase [Candidatus Helarchaeota archaeon]
MSEGSSENIRAIIYSRFGKFGPEPVACYPEIDREISQVVALKSIALLSGEKGDVPTRIASFPFAAFGLNSLILFFELPDPTSRGSRRDCSLTILYKDKYIPIIYGNITIFESKLKNAAKEIITSFLKGFSPTLDFFKKLYLDIKNSAEEFENERQLTIPQQELEPIIKNFKIVCIGDIAVGKTSLINRYIDNTFSDFYKQTAGIEIRMRDIQIGKDLVRLLLYDIAGQERFESLNPTFFKGADAVMILYDITNKDTFSFGSTKWYKDFLKYSSKNLKVGILIGNKTDLEEKRKIKTEWGIELAKKMQFGFVELSAKTGENVNETFAILARKLYEKAKSSSKKT